MWILLVLALVACIVIGSLGSITMGEHFDSDNDMVGAGCFMMLIGIIGCIVIIAVMAVTAP